MNVFAFVSQILYFFHLKKKIISNKTADHFDFNFNFLTSSEKLNL